MKEPRKINIYCDESRYCNHGDPYLVIGAVKMPRNDKLQLVSELNSIKRKYSIGGEFGWKSVSPNKADFYKAVIDWFVEKDNVRFRCVTANKQNLWSTNDEDAFYVVYHQLLYHWLESNNEYYIYLDYKKNSNRHHVDELRRKITKSADGKCTMKCMEEVDSQECVPVQLADFLIGCVGYDWNDHIDRNKYPTSSQYKIELCSYLSKKLGRPRLKFSTFVSETKFNVFNFGE